MTQKEIFRELIVDKILKPRLDNFNEKDKQEIVDRFKESFNKPFKEYLIHKFPKQE